jgi:hypothetical protein
MRKDWGAVIFALAVFVVISVILAWPVMMLWNGCLVGAIDGVHEVSWLQAWGISVLCGFLFKTSASTK